MIKIKNGNIVDIYKGDNPFCRLYQGEDLVWEKEYLQIIYTTTDNVIIGNNNWKNISKYIKSNKYDNGKGYCVLKLDKKIEELTKIDNDFLYGCTTLQSLDLTPLSNVTEIGDSFLLRCTTLQSLDLSPLSKVNKIGNSFLSSCSTLQSLDLTPLSNVTEIGNSFLHNCSGLQSLDLSPLSKVNKIGNSFLSSCSTLQSLDLTPLSNVTEIGDEFISSCSKLQSLDLTPLSNVTEISNSFLLSCSGLQSLDLSPLSKVNKIGNSFLQGCSKLQSLDLSPLSNVTEIGSYFLGYCSNIQSLDLTPLSNVTEMGKDFASLCFKLKTLIIENHDKVVSLPLEKCSITPNVIYVCDALISKYEEVVPKFAGKYVGLGCHVAPLEIRGKFTDDSTSDDWYISPANVKVDISEFVNPETKEFNVQYRTDNVNYLFRDNAKLESISYMKLPEKPTTLIELFNNCTSLKEVEFGEDFDTSKITDMSRLFQNCRELVSVNVKDFNTENVQYLGGIFSGCEKLETIDISGWNTISAITMNSLFRECQNLKSITFGENWTTENVTDLGSMFYVCVSLQSLDVSGWNTAKVGNMECTFARCDNVPELDVSNWITDNVGTMYQMFLGDRNITQLAVEDWNVEKVGDMSHLFEGTGCRKLDLSKWNCKNNRDLTYTFGEMQSLEELKFGAGWNNENLNSMVLTFWGCNILTSLDLSDFNTKNVSSSNMMFGSGSAETKLQTINFGENWDMTNFDSTSRWFEHCSEVENFIGSMKNIGLSLRLDGMKNLTGASKLVVINGLREGGAKDGDSILYLYNTDGLTFEDYTKATSKGWNIIFREAERDPWGEE